MELEKGEEGKPCINELWRKEEEEKEEGFFGRSKQLWLRKFGEEEDG